MYEVSKKIILLCIPLLLSAQFIAGILNEALDLTDTNQELFISMSHNIFGVLSIAIVVPILEEFLFRGAIEGHLLRKGWSPKWAILVSALIFGIIHGNPAQIPFAFLIGLLFGWLYYRTGSLVPGIVGHIINNSFGAWTMFTATREELSHDYGDLGHNNHLHSLSTSHNRFYRYVSLPEQILAETYQHTSQSY